MEPGTATIDFPAGEQRQILPGHISHGKGSIRSLQDQEMSRASTKHVPSAVASDISPVGMSPISKKVKMREAMQNMCSVPVMGEPVIVRVRSTCTNSRGPMNPPILRCHQIFAIGRECNLSLSLSLSPSFPRKMLILQQSLCVLTCCAAFDPLLTAVSDPELSQPHIREDYSHRKFSLSYKDKDVLSGVWHDIDDEVYIGGMQVTAPEPCFKYLSYIRMYINDPKY